MTLADKLEALRHNHLATLAEEKNEHWSVTSAHGKLLCRLFNNLDTIILALRFAEAGTDIGKNLP